MRVENRVGRHGRMARRGQLPAKIGDHLFMGSLDYQVALLAVPEGLDLSEQSSDIVFG